MDASFCSFLSLFAILSLVLIFFCSLLVATSCSPYVAGSGGSLFLPRSPRSRYLTVILRNKEKISRERESDVLFLSGPVRDRRPPLGDDVDDDDDADQRAGNAGCRATLRDRGSVP